MAQSEQDDAEEGKTRRVRKLGDRISEARHLRGLIRDPDLQAVEMERNGRRTLVGLWFFLALGLVFTTTGVQQFLAGDSTRDDPLWWAAWTVEPMFAGLLIVLLNFEAVILAHGVSPDHQWWSRLKRVLLTSTLLMNVIPQLIPLLAGRWAEFNAGSAVVHGIIPVIVYGIAEVIPVIQARQRQVILAAYAAADPPPPPEQPEVPERAATESIERPRPVERPDTTSVIGKSMNLPAGVLKGISDAWERAKTEGREFTPADVRQVVRLPEPMAAQIVADLNATEKPVTNGHAVA
ncbi:hypothetical protein E1202_01775 [Saccharopolyspora karakumensis]|uniref:DUF2637 domain-containing protein n=1 Tax=Saccharopolyspora karakumensis TaxID=2530386 RepID=A0A4V2YYD2_9PSEU|nr:hypothetical protein [Saccharopolyspora karakumensis]TDD92737.1 hypothetical protein E1202_01775 [Saccharopolyspora karakumensis]